INTLIMRNGNFGVTSDLTVTQIVSWTGGSLNAYFNSPAHFTLANTAAMTIANGSALPELYLPLINEGTVTWLGTQSMLAGPKGTWTNNGTLNLYSAPIANVTFGKESVPFTNTGTLRVNATGDVQFDYALLNYGEVVLNSGALNMHWNNYNQWAGHTRLNGGNLAGFSKCCGLENYPIYLYGGALSGSGIITGGIENRGGTVMLTGLLTATGQYLQSVTGTLQVTFTGMTNFGMMNVIKRPDRIDGGSITIDGALIVNQASGFHPASGDRFQIITGLTASGAFQQSSGNLAPSFSGYAGLGAVIVAEPTNAALVQARPLHTQGMRGSDNGYTIAIFNPTTQTLTVNGLTAYLPISFTYKLGSTTGAFHTDPLDSVSNGRRTLSFFPGFTVPARERREFNFGLTIDPALPVGRYPISVDTNTMLASQSHLVKLVNIAPIEMPLGAASNISVGGGTVIVQGDTTNIMFPRSGLAASGLNVRVRIACPLDFEPCGTLSGVYVIQEVNGRGATLFTLQPELHQPTHPQHPDDYGYWTGFIPGGQFLPGVPAKLFPDWDAHRPCIIFDFSGFGIRPLYCVDDGDPIGTPQLYDPSGIIRDAATLQPIAGATVTLLRISALLPDTRTTTRDCRTIDTRPGGMWSGTASGGIFEQPGFAPAQISPDVNPQITGSDGRYGWNVATGCWYVVVTAPGYASKTSALVGVPPAVTDLDLTLDVLNLPNKVYLPLVLR
ncbi:MAG TPA: hypothetical protein VLG46_17725, partial [Anaerolineae bacterium]|nr:hypothetical protein [Anaerolineae bacterium]